MEESSSRRAFLRLTASMCGLRPVRSTYEPARTRHAQAAPLRELPRLDGTLQTEDVARQAAADDWGHQVHHVPLAVLKPGSVADITRVVEYANRCGLNVSMRGQGHSVDGQSQAEGGIVIDSSSLSRLSWPADDKLDAEPGALWGAVATAAIERGRIPPVLPDAMMLSVGGTLSAGGTGDTSCGLGAQVDHVLELDVVTGRGDLVTCSPSREPELFQMVLAGLGQCGLIVRARLRLVRAPTHIVLRAATYGDAEALISDLGRLARADAPPVLGGEVTRDAAGRWRFALLGGTFAEEAGDAPTTPMWMAGLQLETPPRTTRTTLWEHLDRRTASITASKKKGTPNPSLALALTDGSVRAFVASVLSDPEASAGIWRIEVLPMVTARFRQPLHVLPEGPIAFTVRLQRRASVEGGPDHQAMLAANRRLVQRCLNEGGKIYPPFAPVLSHDDWRRHYGPALWKRFVTAKNRFDPKRVLTPGAGIFA